MQETFAADLPGNVGWFSRVTSRARTEAPTLVEWCGAFATALLLILSFPNFDLPLLAWIALVPLLIVVARRPSPARAFLLGWSAGSLFFYVSCYWLTYSMIHYGGLPTWLAYLLLLPGALVVGLFPALFAFLTASVVKRWGPTALFLSPFFWAGCEWFRLGVTGQLWNALGYSQAFSSLLIGTARWGGVYAVSFSILTVNACLVFAILRRSIRATGIAFLMIVALGFVMAAALTIGTGKHSYAVPYLYVVALQPNVPMTVKTVEDTRDLLDRHLSMSTRALKSLPSDNVPRLVVWPESPMNFTYASDRNFQELVAKFTRENHTSLLFNSLEPAPKDGSYNSALLINEDGRLIAQYDKIRLLPFGEYVPLPQWLGGSLISGLVGDFTPGNKYTLMPVAHHRAGVFICIESAYPSIARRFTAEGADVLINVSNDGYLGPTAVMRQHLANAIFRAVENGRPLLRVTNSGLSAWIGPDGNIQEQTVGFQADARNWTVTQAGTNDTFYTKHGDLFAGICTAMTFGALLAVSFKRRRSLTTT